MPFNFDEEMAKLQAAVDAGEAYVPPAAPEQDVVAEIADAEQPPITSEPELTPEQVFDQVIADINQVYVNNDAYKAHRNKWEYEDLHIGAGGEQRTGIIGGAKNGELNDEQAYNAIGTILRKAGISDVNEDPRFRNKIPKRNNDQFVNLGPLGNRYYNAKFKTTDDWGLDVGTWAADPEMGDESTFQGVMGALGPVLSTIGMVIPGAQVFVPVGGAMSGYGENGSWQDAAKGGAKGYSSDSYLANAAIILATGGDMEDVALQVGTQYLGDYAQENMTGDYEFEVDGSTETISKEAFDELVKGVVSTAQDGKLSSKDALKLVYDYGSEGGMWDSGSFDIWSEDFELPEWVTDIDVPNWGGSESIDIGGLSDIDVPNWQGSESIDIGAISDIDVDVPNWQGSESIDIPDVPDVPNWQGSESIDVPDVPNWQGSESVYTPDDWYNAPHIDGWQGSESIDTPNTPDLPDTPDIPDIPDIPIPTPDANFDIPTLLSALGPGAQGGAGMAVETPEVADMDYVYDWSSIFANPRQEQLMPSPYGQGSPMDDQLAKILQAAENKDMSNDEILALLQGTV